MDDDIKKLEEEKLLEGAESETPKKEESVSSVETPVETESFDETETPVVAPIKKDNEKESSEIEEVAKAFAEDKNNTNKTKKGKKKVLVIVGILLFIILLFAGVSAVTVLAAYNKITLPSKALQTKLTNIVTSIPFMPKTKEQVLMLAMEKHKDLKKVSYTVSGSSDYNYMAEMLGVTGSFDVNAHGNLDFSDKDKPKGDVHLVVGKDMTIDILTENYMFYFKLHNLPTQLSVLATSFGVNLDDLEDSWIYIDFTPVESEARDLMTDAKKNAPDKDNSAIVAFLEGFLNEDLFSKLQMSNDTLDGEKMYLLTLELNAEETKALRTKYYEDRKADRSAAPNYYILGADRLKLVVWVGKKDFYVHKVESVIVMEMPTYNTFDSMMPAIGVTQKQNKEVTIASTLSLSNFNKDFELKTPTDSKALNDIINKFVSESTSSAMPLEATSSNGFSNGTTPTPTKPHDETFSGFE